MDEVMEDMSSIPVKQPSQEDVLVAKAKQDLQAFGRLYDLYVQPVYRYLLSKVGNVQDAEDLTGQTFLSAVQSFDNYRHKGRFAAWLFSIARNKTIDFYRKNKNQLSLEATDAYLSRNLGEHYSLKTDRQLDLARLINTLPQEEQELLRLRFIAGMRFREISALLGKNEGAVKKATYRLLDKLQNQLEGYRE